MKMISTYCGPTADSVWQQMAGDFRESRGVRRQDSRAGSTNEILHAVISVEDPRQRWVISRKPPLNIAFALAEVVWIMTGRSDLEFLRYWNNQLVDYVGPGLSLHGSYGYRLRKQQGIDQMMRVYETLLHNPDSRQAVLQIWDSKLDLPQENGTPSSSDIPCNVLAMLKVRDDKLEWAQVIRSNDLFRGVPYNFVQFTTLQEIMSGWLGVECGSYVQFSDSLHVYERDMDDVRSSIADSMVVPSADCLALPLDDSTEVFKEVERRVSVLVDRTKDADEIYDIHKWSDAPVAYQNILIVMVAEALRKRGNIDDGRELMTECSNPAYSQLWHQWLSRLSICS